MAVVISAGILALMLLPPCSRHALVMRGTCLRQGANYRCQTLTRLIVQRLSRSISGTTDRTIVLNLVAWPPGRRGQSLYLDNTHLTRSGPQKLPAITNYNMASTAWIRHRRGVKAQLPDNSRLWIVVGVTASILVLAGITIALAIIYVKWGCCCRRRRRRLRRRPYEEVSSRELPHPKLSIPRHYSGLSRCGSLDPDHEYQRLYIIQKSLAGRAASHDAHADNSDHSGNDTAQRPINMQKSSCQERNAGVSWLNQEGRTGQQSKQPEAPARGCGATA